MRFILYTSAIIFIIFFTACKQKQEVAGIEINIIPKPLHIQQGSGIFEINSATGIIIKNDNKEIVNIAEYFIKTFKDASGIELAVSNEDSGTGSSNSIVFNLITTTDTLGEEGYNLKINESGINILAQSPAGLFYAVQTIRQMLPATSANTTESKKEIKWHVPYVSISDMPRFQWRGMLLDCCRHFMEKDFVKRYIDLLSYYKMNRFHWHLTEDQGWRIEIKKYPELTRKGAWRIYEDGTKYGGYYTQDDIREIVEYAQKRYVTVIPEIEMPGHSLAALASYPEYSCTGGPFEVETNWGVFKDIYCAGNDRTFEFLEDILEEVIDLFPAPYIHIGGDEAPKYRWERCQKCQERIKNEGLKDEHELQSYFIKRIEKFLNSKGKNIIGWDEILEGGLAPGATVQSWRGVEGGIEAARSGHDAIMSPTSHAYFDYDVKTIDLGKVYSFNPVPEELTEEESLHILGGECNMWTERAPQGTIDSKMFPRLLAMSEVLWTMKENKDYEEFHNRVEYHYGLLDAFGVQYGAEAQLVNFTTEYDSTKREFQVVLQPGQKNVEILYTINGSEPTNNSERYTDPFIINTTTDINVFSLCKGASRGEKYKRQIVIHNALYKTIDIINPYSDNYRANGDYALVDGLRGTIDYRDKLWQGYEKDDLDVTIDLGEITPVNTISAGFLQKVPSWIFFPEKLEFYISDNNKDYMLVHEINNKTDRDTKEAVIRTFSCKTDNAEARYVRVFAKNIGKCPDWHPGAGGKAWLFVDEIMIDWLID